MKDPQRAIAVPVHPHVCLHVVKPILVSGYLQDTVVKVHTVVVADRSFILLTEDILKLSADIGHKGRSRLPCRTGKLSIEAGQVAFLQIPVCCLPCLYPLLEPVPWAAGPDGCETSALICPGPQGSMPLSC